MAYDYNPHRHVKIWLSKDKDAFLPPRNQSRLSELRRSNPEAELYLVYDKSLLTPLSIEKLQAFCKKHDLIPIEVRSNIFQNCETQEEKRLIEIYNNEVFNLHHGGNLDAASHILRWFKAIYTKGTYSDFDVFINTKKLDKTIKVDAPFLLNIGSVPVNPSLENLCLNNDIIAVVDPTAAIDTIKGIQIAMYNACKANSSDRSPFRKIIDHYIKNLKHIGLGKQIDNILSQSLDVFELKWLESLSSGCYVHELRKKIIDMCSTNQAFVNSYNLFTNPHSSLRSNKWYQNLFQPKRVEYEEIQELAVKLQKSLLEENQENEFTANFNRNNHLASLTPIPFLREYRKKIRDDLLSNCIKYTTGSLMVTNALFHENFFTPENIDEIVSPHSIKHYPFSSAFQTDNNLPLHATTEDYLSFHARQANASAPDLSWLPEKNAFDFSELPIPNNAREFDERMASYESQKAQAYYEFLKEKIPNFVTWNEQHIAFKHMNEIDSQRMHDLIAAKFYLKHCEGVEAFISALVSQDTTRIKNTFDELILHSERAEKGLKLFSMQPNRKQLINLFCHFNPRIVIGVDKPLINGVSIEIIKQLNTALSLNLPEKSLTEDFSETIVQKILNTYVFNLTKQNDLTQNRTLSLR